VFRLDIPPEDAQALAERLGDAAAAGLFHPAIVEPLAAGVEGTVAWRAEEYVTSESLDVAVREHRPESLADVVAVVAQLAAALDIARAAGIGHGALHPRDVFLGPDGARIGGFGIVSALEAVGVRAPVRRPYTAPERMAGEDWATPADVYSLAAVVFEWMTGRRPAGPGYGFGSFDPSPFASVQGLDTIFARAMDEEPRRRFTSATDFCDALARVDAAGRGVAFTPPALAGSSLLDLPEEVANFADEDDMAGAPGAAASAAAAAGMMFQSADAGEGTGPEQEEDVSGGEFPNGAAAFADVEDERDADEGHWRTIRDDEAAAGDHDLYAPDESEAAADAFVADAAGMALNERASRFDEESPEPGTGDGEEGEEREEVERWAPGVEPEPESDTYEDEPEEPEQPGPGSAYSAASLEEPADAEPRRFTFEPVETPAPERPVAAGLGLSGAAAAARAPEGAPRRPYRRLEDDDIVGVEPPPAAERSRPPMLPLAMTLILGLLLGFAAGFTVGERSALMPAADGTAAARTTDGAEGSPAPAASPATGTPGADANTPTPVPDTAADTPAPARGVPPAPAASAPPAARNGHLVVRSTPSGAAVIVNGRWSGRTPLTLDRVALGRHAVRVVLPGYQTAREDVQLTSQAASRTLTITLQRTPAAAPAATAASRTAAAQRGTAGSGDNTPAASAATTGVLQIDSRPTGARVLLDGTPLGTTPIRIPEVAPGAHTIRLELADHLPWTTTADVKAGETARIGGSLEPTR
jgi:hypothetical protein